MEVDWIVEDCLGSWWRPNFEAPQVTLCKRSPFTPVEANPQQENSPFQSFCNL